MPIHDLWHFENAPQGINLAVAANGTAYNANTIYNQYTGNIGQPQSVSSSTCVVSSDGFLTFPSNGAGGFLCVPLNAVQDWSVATQYWVGFRTKLITAYTGTAYITLIGSTTANPSYVPMLTEAMMTTAGFATVGTEYYVEIFIDRTAVTFQTYVNGVLVNSGALTTTVLASGAGILQFGPNAPSGLGSGNRGYRDFYFLDVDAVKTPNRLGQVRAKAATITAATASEYTPQGAATLLAALNTSFGSAAPTNTPNVLSSTDGQPLVQTLQTGFVDSQVAILGVQPIASFASNTAAPPGLAASFTDSNGGNVAAGTFQNSLAGPFYNQKLPLVQTGPNGAKWTAAEINQSQYVLTPQ